MKSLRINSRKLQIFQSVLIVFLSILVLLTIHTMNKLQGTARIINFAGIVRGATQRCVKMEIANFESENLILILDDTLQNLKNGGGKDKLVKLDDKVFVKNLETLSDYWKKLKVEIRNFRKFEDKTKSNLIEMSEEYFRLADLTVFSAEAYSERITTRLTLLEIAIFFVMFTLILILVYQTINGLKLDRKNRVLKTVAFIDKHTKLPNKSRCQMIFSDVSLLDKKTACIMFDLNYLKKVNDTLGHIAGDTMILNFASIIRKSIPSNQFVGRYGGDEFVSVLKNIEISELEKIVSEVESEIQRYNDFSHQIKLSYACGFAHSSEFTECNLSILLEKADQRMYEQKQKTHAQRD